MFGEPRSGTGKVALRSVAHADPAVRHLPTVREPVGEATLPPLRLFHGISKKWVRAFPRMRRVGATAPEMEQHAAVRVTARESLGPTERGDTPEGPVGSRALRDRGRAPSSTISLRAWPLHWRARAVPARGGRSHVREHFTTLPSPPPNTRNLYRAGSRDAAVGGRPCPAGPQGANCGTISSREQVVFIIAPQGTGRSGCGSSGPSGEKAPVAPDPDLADT